MMLAGASALVGLNMWYCFKSCWVIWDWSNLLSNIPWERSSGYLGPSGLSSLRRLLKKTYWSLRTWPWPQEDGQLSSDFLRSKLLKVFTRSLFEEILLGAIPFLVEVLRFFLLLLSFLPMFWEDWFRQVSTSIVILQHGEAFIEGEALHCGLLLALLWITWKFGS